jgi:mono-ADP-ribosyltransferase sirtuin 6
MSGGYASRLSDYPNKGVVGLPEIYDTHRTLTVKIKRLTAEIQSSTNIVILTGAGISTAAKIPDFRGPNGFWTKEKLQQQLHNKSKSSTLSSSSRKKRKRSITGNSNSNSKTETETNTSTNSNSNDPSSSSSSSSSSPSSSSSSSPPPERRTQQQQQQQHDNFTFAEALPTLTHRAITKLILDGKVRYCVTQNVDGLHRRSGLSRNYHSAVHGCVFTEKCARSNCGCEYFGDVELDGLSFQKTENKCEECVDGGDLRDILLDWEDPVLDMERVQAECERADLILCLGTSLRIEPVGSLPLLAKKFVIINLQATPFDEQAKIVVRAKVDDVMTRLMSELGYKHNWMTMEPSPCIERKWKPTVDQNIDWAYMMDNEVTKESNN